MVLLSVPNVSEGRDAAVISAVQAGFEQGGARVVDIHSDGDHNRSVYSLAGAAPVLVDSLVAGARAAIARIDLTQHQGVHPRVGVLDVAPLVFITEEQRGLASAAALTLGDRLGEELGLPIFLYGELAGGRTRADIRAGGPERLAERILSENLLPDFGPHKLHPTAGAVLVSARRPLVAFNVELDSDFDLTKAKAIATLIREGGHEGLPGLRAIGVELASRERVQVSTNIELPDQVSAADVVRAVERHATVVAAELVGLAPQASFSDFPPEIPLAGYDPLSTSIEGALGL